MLTFLVPDLVPNPEIFFGHQMGPEQTLRRETWTDRREITLRVSFIFENQDLTPTYNGCVISRQKRKTNCEFLKRFLKRTIQQQNDLAEPVYDETGTARADFFTAKAD